MSPESGESSGPDVERMRELLRIELVSIPPLKWGYFFPCQVAVWRYIHERAPSLVDEFRGGFDDEPYFEARGAEWFCDTWAENERFWDACEALLLPLAKSVSPIVRQQGYLLMRDLPDLPLHTVRELVAVVEEGLRKEQR